MAAGRAASQLVDTGGTEPSVSQMAGDLLSALDPAAVMRRGGLVPDAWQAQLLRSQARRILMLCSRQSGKSTTVAVAALHEALYRSPALTLLLSPSLRQSAELFKIVTGLYGHLGRPVGIEQESALKLELANGSRIVSLPGTEETVRGFSGVALLVVDEAARVDDALYYAVRPMLAVSGGRLIALSTPFGKRGWFWEEWDKGQGWERIKITARECPRITQEFLEDERQHLGDWWWRQEYGVEFVEAETQPFTHEMIMRAVRSDIRPLWETP